MQTTHPARIARMAGLLYLAIIVLGIGSEIFVRSALIDFNDPAATAHNVFRDRALIRASLAADTVMAVCDVALAVLLYVLLKPAGAILALLAMVFRLVQASILGMNLLNQYMGLLIATGGAPLSGVSPETTGALALLFFNAQSHGYDLGLIFFAMNCLITGVLIWRSEYVPSWIGGAVAAAGVVYLIGSGLRFLAPEVYVSFQPTYLVPLISETAFALWLVTRGTGRAAQSQPD